MPHAHDTPGAPPPPPRRLNAARRGYQPHEHVAHVAVAAHPLSIEDGTLTRTMKPRRQEILKRYAADVDRLMHSLRG